MPVNLSRLEPGVYLSAWVGIVTSEEFLDVNPMQALLEQTGDPHVVVVVDSSECKQYPLSIDTLKQANANVRQLKTVGYVFITAPSTIKALAVALTRLMNMKIAFCGSHQEALETARRYLAEAASKEST